MKRPALIAGLTAAFLATTLLAASPTLARNGDHSGSSGYRIVFDSRQGLTYFSGNGGRYSSGVRHGHRYTHKFRHHHLKSRHDRRARRYNRRNYRSPVSVHGGGRCHPTEKIVYGHDGRRIRVGGTMCYDRYGNPYITGGSRHFMGRY